MPAKGGNSGWELGEAMLANEGKSCGFLARAGDPRGAASPDWSHDGKTIVYVSTDASKDGRLATGVADLWSVPYANKGGRRRASTGRRFRPFLERVLPVPLSRRCNVAFNRAPAGENAYSNERAEVFLVPSAGGTAVRLAANDPPACKRPLQPRAAQ